jgi:hypothetical protein
MHKGLILLVDALSRTEGQEKAERFLAPYRGRIFDYFLVGGSYSGVLTGYDPRSNPANTEMCSTCLGTGADLRSPEACCACAGTGKSLKFPSEWEPYPGDVIPLRDVREKVSTLARGWHAKQQEKIERLIAESSQDRGLVAFLRAQKRAVLADKFLLWSDVYDVEMRRNAVPDEPEGRWAVVVDMHS